MPLVESNYSVDGASVINKVLHTYIPPGSCVSDVILQMPSNLPTSSLMGVFVPCKPLWRWPYRHLNAAEFII